MGDDEEGVTVERIALMPAPLRMDEKDGGLHLHFRLRSEVHAPSRQRRTTQRCPRARPNGLETHGPRRAARIWDAACYRSLQIHTNTAFLDAV